MDTLRLHQCACHGKHKPSNSTCLLTPAIEALDSDVHSVLQPPLVYASKATLTKNEGV